MKKKYSITIANTEMNVLTEEESDFVDEIVAILDRKIREINTACKHCSKTEAALLCALDCYSEKMKNQKKLNTLEAEAALKNAQINRLTAENERLRQSLTQHKITPPSSFSDRTEQPTTKDSVYSKTGSK